MPLIVDYVPSEQLARLELSGHPTTWAEIRSLCEERSSEVENTSSTVMTIPWWGFLSCRKAIAYVLERHGVEFAPTSQAESLLLSALSNEKHFQSALKASPRNPIDLSRTLLASGFKRPLTKEQLRNVSKLASLPAGATFSVPGAGKTTEALAYYWLTRAPEDRLLVVAPKNAFAAWEEQLVECLDSPPPIIRLRGGADTVRSLLQGSPTAAIITYQQLAIVKDQIARYVASKPAYLFLDESHRMKKGVDGVLGNAVLSLSHLPKAKLILSGTPLPNSRADLIPQFDFLYPEIRAEESTVEELIQPIYVRTTKAELGLRKPTRRFIEVPMSPAQRKLYDLLRSEEARQSSALLKSWDRNALRALGRSSIRLLQLASNPALIANLPIVQTDLLREVLSEGQSTKIAYACTRARALARQNRKTIIWSTFIPNVELLASQLRDLGADFIHGGVEAGSEEDSDTREAKIRRFHDDKFSFVLVANPAACSEGISLHTACHNAIYVDRTYNAAQYLQSEDRIHRLGLAPTTKTEIEILVSPHSIDDSVRRRLEAKVAKMAKVLNDKSLSIEETTTDLDDSSIDDLDARDILEHLRNP